MVRANLSQVVIGNTNRATESRHATGAEAEIPDISEYSRGRKGYFQIWDPQAKEITARGRTFLLGVPPDELAYCKSIVDARKGTGACCPRWNSPCTDRQEHAPEAAAPGVSEMRARLAAARERSDEDTRRRSAAHCPARGARGHPPGRLAVLLGLLAAPEGTTASAGGLAIGKSKWVAYEYLAALREHGIAELTGAGRGSGSGSPGIPRGAAAGAEPEQPAGQPYMTIQALAQAVHAAWPTPTRHPRGPGEGLGDRAPATRPRLTVAAAPDRPGEVTHSDRRNVGESFGGIVGRNVVSPA